MIKNKPFSPAVIGSCALAVFCPAVLAQQEPVAGPADPSPEPAAQVAEPGSARQPFAARGPLPIRNSRPFNLLFLQFAPQDAGVLSPGEKALGLQLDIINNLLAPAVGGNGATVIEDNEMQRLQFSWRQGIGKRTEAQFVLPVLARNGGILDGPISAYHKLLGLDGNGEDNPIGRDSLPRGRSVLFYQNATGQTVSAGNAFGLGDASFFLKHQLSSGKRSALALRAGLKVPTGSEKKYLGSGGFDAGFSLDGQYALGRHFNLYGSLGAAALGSADLLPGAGKSTVQGSLALEWTRKRSSIIAQVDANSRVLTTGNSFADGTQSTVTVGYKRQLSRDRTFYASFSENGDYHNYNVPALGNVGPDFTLTFGMEWRR